MTDLCKINKRGAMLPLARGIALNKGGVKILLTIGIDKAKLFDYNKNR